MTDTLPGVAQRKALAIQLERALLAARRAARLTGVQGPLPALSALAYQDARSIDPDVLQCDWGPAWRRFADMALINQGNAPTDPCGFVAAAPLPAVDVYIDLAASSVQPTWWASRSAGERLYLMARTQPAQLSDDDLVALDWRDEMHRRQLARGLPCQAGETAGSELFQTLAAAASGDVAALERLTGLLPSHNAAVINQVRAGAQLGDWPTEITNDRGLWLLMLRLWAPDATINPARSAFHRWAAFRHAYDLTLARSFKAAWSQITAFPARSKPATRLQKEVENLRAYLTLVRYQDTAAIQQAMTILQDIHSPAAAKANQEVVRRRSRLTTNERGTCENPYLALGVDHGSPPEVWKRAWRSVRAESSGDVDELSRVNEARDTIMALERDGVDGRGQIFIVPFETKLLTPYVEWQPGRLVPEPRPYQNKTSHLLELAMQELRAEAIRELAGAASHAVTANGE